MSDRHKRLVCPDCGRDYQSNYLAQHRQRRHLGGYVEPRAACPLCGKSVVKSHISNHLSRVHVDTDEVAVERAAKGERGLGLNRAEMLAAFEWLNARGYSLIEIAARLGVSDRTVVRWRVGLHKPCGRPAQIAARIGKTPRSVTRIRTGGRESA